MELTALQAAQFSLAVKDVFSEHNLPIPGDAGNAVPDLDTLRKLAYEVKKRSGLKQSHVYELLARGYGFSTYSALLATKK